VTVVTPLSPISVPSDHGDAATTRRRLLTAVGGLAALAAPGLVAAEERKGTMEIERAGSQPSGKGPEEYFTGTVRIDPLNSPPEPARVAMALVTFEPGARTAWHTHPLGQTLIVTASCGRGLVRAGREALARGDTDDGDDAYRHSGGAGR
jgi:uncharacterized RmlC-like cupin family protein